MPNPQNRYPDELRAEIADYIRAHAGTPEGSIRAIARHFEISKTTVGVIADEYDLRDAWTEGAEKTANATSTRRTHVAAQRALMQEDLLDKAADLMDRIDDRVTHLNVVRVGENMEEVERTELPPGPGDYRAMAGAIATLTRASVELAKLDNDTSRTDASLGLLAEFRQALTDDPELADDEEGPAPSEPA